VLVLDANVVLPACGSPKGFSVFGKEELVGPPLLWPEARSSLHEALWRGDISGEDALRTFENLKIAPVASKTHRLLAERAWSLAEQLGWAKTYDAEYVALAELLKCRLVTLDLRLKRGTDHLGFVIDPSEI